MNEKKPLITISIPILNEEANLNALYDRLVKLGETMRDRCELEFLFSDNHSGDNSWQILSTLSQRDPRVRAIRFSKNFGFQRSILANYLHARGDAVLQIDADLQDPPELLEDFFSSWQQGYQVVYGIRRKRPENFIFRFLRRLGCWLIDKLSDHPIPPDVGDFRLVDRKVIQALSQMKTPHPYLRGMIANLGFNQTGIPYDRSERNAGQSKFNGSQLVRLGLTAIFNHSTVPLRAASLLGVLILGLSGLGAIYTTLFKNFSPDTPHSFTSLHFLVLFGIGLNALLMGIIGEYLLRIYLLLRGEPIAIVQESLNMNSKDIKL
ncbi:MAG: glycosyltransferase family 2 protein [Bdellovibrionales bacterium]|nr:glycosyltransferase family 2 protein [Bdellovibrionales bacterium]